MIGVRYLAKKSTKAKSPKPRSLTRTKRDGTTYKVTLLGDYHSHRVPALPDVFIWEPSNLTEPRLVQGWVMPVQVRVEGLADVLVLTVSQVMHGPTQFRFYCTKVEVLPAKEGGEVVGIPLTLDSYVKDAVELASLQCVAYPSNYDGPMIVNEQLDAPEGGWRFTTGEGEKFASVLGWLDKVPTKLVREVTSLGGPRRRNEDTDEKLDLVARTWLDAVRNGSKVEEAVWLALIDHNFHCELSNAQRLIKKAKGLGLIPRTMKEVRK